MDKRVRANLRKMGEFKRVRRARVLMCRTTLRRGSWFLADHAYIKEPDNANLLNFFKRRLSAMEHDLR